jgi:fatty acid desaturase
MDLAAVAAAPAVAPRGFRLLPGEDPARLWGVGPSSHPAEDERARRHEARQGLVARRGITGIAAIATMVTIWCSFLAWSVDGISWAAHAVVVIPSLYFVCICIHDGCHFMLTPWRRVTDVIGFCLSLLLGVPFPLLRASHLAHHRHFGTEKDPEFVVYGAAPTALPFRLLRVPAFYFRAWRDLGRVDRAVCVVHSAVVVAFVAVVGADAWLGLVVPALLTIAWFGATTVYVPHAPVARRLMKHLTGHSGYHDEHHRNVAVPYNQYWELRLRDLRVGLSVENYRGETAMLAMLNRPLGFKAGQPC